jgi:CheY-like chemotaxis protein
VKILMVDDEQDIISVVEAALQLVISELQFESVGTFSLASEKIKSFRPDVLILDWVDDADSSLPQDSAGKRVLDEYWNGFFGPVVVYSAHSGEIDDGIHGHHPLIVKQEKGMGTEQIVVQKIQELRPHIDAIGSALAAVDGVRSSIFRELAPVAFAGEPDHDRRSAALVRAAHRRIAAILEQKAGDQSRLLPWERYIIPVIENQPLMGDIVLKRGENMVDTGSFRVLLTPSCDMRIAPDGKCKSKLILVALCWPVSLFIDKGMNKGTATQAKKADALRSAANHAHQNGWVVFPGFAGKFPTFCIDLRQLELIPSKDIVDETLRVHDRIASLASPYREQLAWAFAETACRTGIPSADVEKLVESILGTQASIPNAHGN